MKALATLLIAIGVIAGAFGAHGLKGIVPALRLEVFRTASFYNITIATVLLVLANYSSIKTVTLRCLALGIVLFSSSLYLLVLLDIKKLGAITPIGGVLIITSLLFASYDLFKDERFKDEKAKNETAKN